MLVKFGVGGLDLSSLDPHMWDAVKAVSKAYDRQEVVITSTWEGTHVPWSMHYRKRALDFRLPVGDPQPVIEKIRKQLGKDYDVVLEIDHIHIEYDPKEG